MRTVDKCVSCRVGGNYVMPLLSVLTPWNFAFCRCCIKKYKTMRGLCVSKLYQHGAASVRKRGKTHWPAASRKNEQAAVRLRGSHR
eukprot:601939-Prymnesium_polylepis.1